MDICSRAGIGSFDDFKATSLSTLAQMVAMGLGITLLPEMSVPDFSQMPGIAVRRFAEPIPKRRIGLVWRPGSANGDSFRTLGRMFEAHCHPAG